MFWNWHINITQLSFSLSFINLVGYVIAPVLSLFAIYVFNKVVVEIKSVGILKGIFGFKIR